MKQPLESTREERMRRAKGGLAMYKDSRRHRQPDSALAALNSNFQFTLCLKSSVTSGARNRFLSSADISRRNQLSAGLFVLRRGPC
jgi:hypothetical protein